MTLKIVVEKQICTEWLQKGNSETKMFFSDYEKVAQVVFTHLNKSVDVVYKEYSSYTDCGFEDRVRIEVIQPIWFEIIEQGLNAQERCEKKMCQAIERLVPTERISP